MSRSFALKSLLHFSHSYAIILLATGGGAGEATCLTEGVGAGVVNAVDDFSGTDMMLVGDDLELVSVVDEEAGGSCSPPTLENGGVDSGWQTYRL